MRCTDSDYPAPTAFWRDHMIAWSKDLGRSLDYLETREDIDHTNVADFGVSRGSVLSPVLLAREERFKAAILAAGGAHFSEGSPGGRPDQLRESRQDPRADGERAIRQLLDRWSRRSVRSSASLGRPRRTSDTSSYESGHGVLGKDLIHESLDWLDTYLGPVKH